MANQTESKKGDAMKIGDKVVMNDKYYVSEENKGKVWTVRSEPWECSGTLVVLLEGRSGGYAVDGIDIIEEAQATIEYIEREKVYETLKAALDETDNLSGLFSQDYIRGCRNTLGMIIEDIQKIPAADVRPERHGRWIKDRSGVLVCSECGEEHEWEDYRATYCEDCGTRMDGKGYQPKIIRGKVKGTGYPIDGRELLFSLWDYDNYESYHLSGWRDDDDEAVMMTIYQSENEAGLCVYATLEDFTRAWKAGEYEPDGVFCLEPDNVDVLEVIQKRSEKDGEDND